MFIVVAVDRECLVKVVRIEKEMDMAVVMVVMRMMMVLSQIV